MINCGNLNTPQEKSHMFSKAPHANLDVPPEPNVASIPVDREAGCRFGAHPKSGQNHKKMVIYWGLWWFNGSLLSDLWDFMGYTVW